MKLIVQIPCLNEEWTLPQTIEAIPRCIKGIDSIELLIVDDGSTDGTVERARQLGVHYLVKHSSNQGLARSFRDGLEACILLGADIVVNTDGDNQYFGGDIPRLIQSILDGTSDIVIGDRQTSENSEFSFIKRLLQRLGTYVVKIVSGVEIADAVSGFRAFSRDAAESLIVISRFSYTTETIIQAGYLGLRVTSIPVRTNRQTRESRLFRSLPHFICMSTLTILRVYLAYSPLRFFAWLSLWFCVIGSLPIIRFLYFYFTGGGAGHVQSLILGAAFLIISVAFLTVGLLAEVVAWNRQLLEQLVTRARRNDRYNSNRSRIIELNAPIPPLAPG